MKNQDINDRSDIRMVLESLIIIVGKMGNKNGSLDISESSPRNVSHPLLFKDIFDATKCPTLVSHFKIPDGRGNLISLFFGIDQKIVLKVRELDQKEIDLYGHIIFREFNHESNVSNLKYFYNVVSFVSCFVAYEDLKKDLALLQQKYLEIKDNTEVSDARKTKRKNFFERKKLEIKEFENEFSNYLTGEHLFEKL